MKQHFKQSRGKLLAVIMIAAGLAGPGLSASASAANAGASAGGEAATHMSPAGTANTNAQWQTEASKGTDRAGERMSEQGAENRHMSGAEGEAAAALPKGKRTGKR